MNQEPGENSSKPPEPNASSAPINLGQTELQKSPQTKAPSQSLIKTVLDIEAVKNVAAALKAKSDQRLRERLKNQTNEPFHGITEYLNASPCDLKSKQNLKEGDRIGYCERCRLQFYDFSKMEIDDVKQLILQREGKRDPVLFKRKDGRFITQDCPVALQRKSQLVVYSCAAFVAFMIAGYVMIKVLQSAPRPVVAKSTETIAASKKADSSILPMGQKFQKSAAEKTIAVQKQVIDEKTLPMGANFNSSKASRWQKTEKDSQPIDPSTLPMGTNFKR